MKTRFISLFTAFWSIVALFALLSLLLYFKTFNLITLLLVCVIEFAVVFFITRYWIQKEVKPSKKAKESKVYYEYYAVWGMTKKLYDAQIQSAMSSIEDNTDEGKALKEALSLKLQNMMITSNNEEVNTEAEETLEAK